MHGYDPGYQLTAFGQMLLNQPRTSAYLAAMEQVIKPGDVVLEIGAGPGIFAMLAARMGAKKVIAVECNPSIRLARRLVQHNNLTHRVQCIEGISTKLTLEEPADVIISDLRSVLPLFSHHIPSLIDARERLLAPGGTLIGRQDTLFAAPVEHFEEHRRLDEPWRNNSFGLNLAAGAEFEGNRWSKIELLPEQLLAEEKPWCTLDYHKVTHPAAQASLTWTIKRAGHCHGIAAWFDAELASGVEFSNHPAKARLIYGQAFMPLPRAVQVQAGAQVAVEIYAYWVKQNYIWRWKGEIRNGEGVLIDCFDQSSLGRRYVLAD